MFSMVFVHPFNIYWDFKEQATSERNQQKVFFPSCGKHRLWLTQFYSAGFGLRSLRFLCCIAVSGRNICLVLNAANGAVFWWYSGVFIGWPKSISILFGHLLNQSDQMAVSMPSMFSKAGKSLSVMSCGIHTMPHLRMPLASEPSCLLHVPMFSSKHAPFMKISYFACWAVGQVFGGGNSEISSHSTVFDLVNIFHGSYRIFIFAVFWMGAELHSRPLFRLSLFEALSFGSTVLLDFRVSDPRYDGTMGW